MAKALSENPYRRLAAALLLRALRDAQAGDAHSAEARAWLLGDPVAESLCGEFGIEPGAVRAVVAKLENRSKL